MPSFKKRTIRRISKLMMFVLLTSIVSSSFPWRANPAMAAAPEPTVVTHDAPEAETLSTDFTVSVSGKEVPVYIAEVAEGQVGDAGNHGTDYAFAYFDFSGTVDVTVKAGGGRSAAGAVILPASLGITPAISGSDISFQLTKPANMSIEINGKDRPLLLFANPLEVDAPESGDANVLYYGPGLHTPADVGNNGVIQLTAGQTLYLAPGAILQAAIIATGDNITIRGRGILDQTPWQHWQGPKALDGTQAHQVIFAKDSNNFKLEGIIIRGAWSWSVLVAGCDGVHVDNLKEVNSRFANDDGFDPANSKNIVVENSFFRTDDDSIAVKGTHDSAVNGGTDGMETGYMIVRNSTFWSDRARIFLIGDESHTPRFTNITYENIDIIHYWMNPFLLRPGSHAPEQNIRFENIRINGAGQPGIPLVELTPAGNEYNQYTPGSIDGVVFKNIFVHGVQEEAYGDGKVVVKGFGPDHAVANVTFENFYRYGTLLTEDSPNLQVGAHTSGISFTSSDLGSIVMPPSIPLPPPPPMEEVRVDKVANAGFETVGDVWWSWNNTNMNPSSVASYSTDGAHSGSTFMLHGASNPYEQTTSQTVTGLANGKYKIKGWVKHSGEFNRLTITARNYGGETSVDANLDTDWRQYETDVFTVTNNQVEILFWTTSNGGVTSAGIDDIELYKLVEVITEPEPAVNLVGNPGFETAINPDNTEVAGSWTYWNDAWERVTGQARTGDYAVRLGNGPASAMQIITVEPNTEYVLTGWGKIPAGDREMRIGVQEYGGSDQYAAISGTDYTKGTVTFTTGAENTTAKIFIHIPDGEGNSYADDISVMKSSVVVSHNMPVSENPSDDFTVSVSGYNVPVYQAKVDPNNPNAGTDYSFAYFDFSGKVDVTVKATGGRNVDSAVVLPQSAGITPVNTGSTIRFTLDEPRNLSIEIDGKNKPLLLFANPLEEDAPAAEDDNVIYFGPGLHTPAEVGNNGVINLTSNQTLYLAPGSIVQAAVVAKGDNITIRGRGILDQSPWGHWAGPSGVVVLAEDCTDFMMEGIIIRGAWSWTIKTLRSDGIVVDNLKQVNGKNPNDDGFDPSNSRNITVKNSFFRNDDDSIAVKGDNKAWGETGNMLVENSVFWSDRARIFLIGDESGTPSFNNITYRNIDILHFAMAPFLLRPGNAAVMQNITFEDIRINGTGLVGVPLVEITPTMNEYTGGTEAGSVDGVQFKNIHVTGAPSGGNNARYVPGRIVIKGYDSTHGVNDISFENFYRYGSLLDSSSEQLEIGDFTSNIAFASSGEPPAPGTPIEPAPPLQPFKTDEWYKIVSSHSGKALAVENGSTEDEASIVQNAYYAGAEQWWKFVDAGDGYYKLVNRYSGKVLNVEDGSAADDATIVQSADGTAASMLWKPVDIDGNRVAFLNKNSGKALCIAGASISNGGKAIQYTYGGSGEQQWTVTEVAGEPEPPGTNTTEPPPAGINLVQNNGFETGDFTPWLNWNDAWQVVTGQARTGDYAVRLGNGPASAMQIITVEPDTEYVLTGWGKVPANGRELRFGVVNFNGGNNLYASVNSVDYAKGTVTFTTGETNTTAEIYIHVPEGTGLTGNSYADDIYVIKSGSDNEQPPVTEEPDITPDNPNISYIGRWDRSDPASYNGYWAGTYFKTGFTGTTAKMKLGGKVDLSVSIDGGPEMYFKDANGLVDLTPVPLADTEHTLRVSTSNRDRAFKFQGLFLDEGRATAEATVHNKLVEFVGDSITMACYTCDPWGAQNAYPWLTGEALGVEHTQIAANGISLTNGYGYIQSESPDGMAANYFKLKSPNFNASNSDWNTSRYAPSVIVVNLGTNDQSTNAPGPLFQSTYTSFLTNLREAYPDTEILALRTFGNYFPAETMNAVKARNDAGDSKVHYVDTTGWINLADTNYSDDGVHPTKLGHELVRDKLTPIIAQYLQEDSGNGGWEGTAAIDIAPVVTYDKLASKVSLEIKATIDIATGAATAKVDAAGISALLRRASQEKSDAIAIRIDGAAGAKEVELHMPKDAFKQLADDKKAQVKIVAGMATVALDSKAIGFIGSSAAGDITIGIKAVDMSTLPAEVQGKAGDRPVYDFTVKTGNTVLSGFGGGKAEVSIPYVLKPGEKRNSIVVYYVDDAGKMKTVKGKYDEASGTVRFIASHFSIYAVGYNEIKFSDVEIGSRYEAAVEFMAARGMINGVGGGKFAPGREVTRAEFLVMVMNAYGIELDSRIAANFVDAGNSYYTAYLATAKRLGLVEGIGNNRFAPEAAISRQDMLVILYNVLNKLGELPAPSAGKALDGYVDAGEISGYAAKAVKFFVDSEMYEGDGGNLNPKSATLRELAVRVLYNLLSKE